MIDYPETMQDFMDRFVSEQACARYLAHVRWGNEFTCPSCTHHEAWYQAKGVFRCKKCRRDISVTAGTILQDSRVPLRTWLLAAWFVVSQKNGVSALGLARVIGIKRYETAWELLRKIRKAMIRPGCERLSGLVEVDEVFIGGVRHGKRGRGAIGKVLVLVAVEDKVKAGFGRIRITIIPDATATSLRKAINEMIEPGSTIRTDEHSSYPSITKHGYSHIAIKGKATVPGEDPTPLVHRIASLLKRWLLGTHHGRVEESHLQEYLNEFVFRFNRRTSRSRGKLFYRLIQNLTASK